MLTMWLIWVANVATTTAAVYGATSPIPGVLRLWEAMDVVVFIALVVATFKRGL